MKMGSVADVEAHFSAYLKASEQGPVVVTRNGKPVAVLIGMPDEDELERLMIAYSPRVQATLDAARRRLSKGSGIGHDEFWEDVESDETKAR